MSKKGPQNPISHFLCTDETLAESPPVSPKRKPNAPATPEHYKHESPRRKAAGRKAFKLGVKLPIDWKDSDKYNVLPENIDKTIMSVHKANLRLNHSQAARQLQLLAESESDSSSPSTPSGSESDAASPTPAFPSRAAPPATPPSASQPATAKPLSEAELQNEYQSFRKFIQGSRKAYVTHKLNEARNDKLLFSQVWPGILRKPRDFKSLEATTKAAKNAGAPVTQHYNQHRQERQLSSHAWLFATSDANVSVDPAETPPPKRAKK